MLEMASTICKHSLHLFCIEFPYLSFLLFDDYFINDSIRYPPPA